MDVTTTTFGKQKLVSISKTLAVILFIIFIGCTIATGLLVYHLSSTCSDIHHKVDEEYLIFNKHPSSTNEVTTIQNDLDLETPLTTTTTKEKLLGIEETNDGGVGDVKEERTIEDDVRLPRALYPQSYKIYLIPFIFDGNFTFHGNVTILLNVTESCNNITLHIDDLIIDEISVSHLHSNRFHLIREFINDKKKQFLIVYLTEPLESGQQYIISIKFRGILNDLLQGFYRSFYKAGNETRWIASTQFQATDARRAFPCFDEPALKARFQINLARPRNMTSISNMRKIDGKPQGVEELSDYVWDHYEESLPMSTYLVAFVISDFESISNGSFSVWTRKSAISQVQYSLKLGPQILKYYEDFFGIKYPLPKVDMVALPDFSAGAMENWGLITYRESVLLYEDKISGKSNLQGIAHVIAHELAHQWFGNLVTPVWWSDLWLNEGFATYMEYLGANFVNPTFKELDLFVVHEIHGAFALDALKSSHQISVKVNNPDEINDIFDRISYSKGAAILRMIQHFLSMDVFRRGLNKYLISRKYKNAEQDDLWHYLTQQSHNDDVLDKNITIKEIMDTWTLQTGFPVVEATRNYDTNSVKFTQSRFLLDEVKNDRTLWWVPISYTSELKPVQSVWLKKEPSIEIEGLNIGKTDWLLLNVNQTGYYRVNYDKTNWELIIRQLQKKSGHLVFDVKNRAQLLDDAMNLAFAGYLGYDVALNLTSYLVQEREFVPWKTAFTSLDYLFERFVRTSHFDKYKNFILKLIKNVYNEVGFKENVDDEQLLIYTRYEIYSHACLLGVRNCIIHSVQQFENWKNSLNPDKYNTISENLREVVYCTAISVGGEEEWNFAWQRYLNTNVGSEKEIILTALGCSKEIWILNRYLECAITENSGIRKQHSAWVFAAVAKNPIGQELAYKFLKTQWTNIRNYLGPSSMSLSSIVRSCTSKFNTRLEVDDFRNFLNNRSSEFGIALRTAQQSLEQGEANVKWMEKHFHQIVHWLSNENEMDS